MASTTTTSPATNPSDPPTADRPFLDLSDAVTYLNKRKETLKVCTTVISYKEKLRQLHAAYVAESNDAISTEECFHIFALLSGIAEYAAVVQSLKEMESTHRIFSAEYITHANGGASRPAMPLNFDAAIQFVADEHMVAPFAIVQRSYGNRIVDEARPVALQIFFRACGAMASVWGEFLAHEFTTVEHYVSVMDDFATDFSPPDRALQVAPIFSRDGAIQGWNAFASAVDDVLEANRQEFSATKCSADRLKELFITAARKAFAEMATLFQARVTTWAWTATPFNHAEKAYSAAFKQFLRLTGIRDSATGSSSSAPVPSFSLTTHTERVRPVRLAPPITSGSTTRATLSSSERPSKVRRLDGALLRQVENTQEDDTASEENSTAEERTRADLLRKEQEQCRRRMERREMNRMRNRELPSWRLKELHMHDFRQLRHHLHGDAEEFFELDDPDSDNEELIDDNDIYLNSNKDTNAINAINERIDLEVLYEEILSTCVDPRADKAAPSLWSYVRDHGRDDSAWLRTFIARNLGMLLVEATRAPDSLHYTDHQKALIHLEAHYQVASALFEAFPELLRYRNTWPLVDELDTPPYHKDRFVISVEKHNNTRLLSNLQCRTFSADHNVRRAMISAFPGMSICVGYFKKPSFDGRGDGKSSPLMLFLCRYITQDSTELEHNNEDGNQLDDVKVYLITSRYWSDLWNVGFGDIVTLIPFASFVSVARQFRAAHDFHLLPENLRAILYEPSAANPRDPLPRRKLPRSRQEYEQSLPPLDGLRSKVDPGSLAYVDSLSSTVCDESQKRAIITSLAEMSSMLQDSSSMSGIFGPPGTGKSTCICLAIGAILHHSVVGHVGAVATRRSVLKNNTKLIFSNDKGVRILVTCPSNHGVDHIAAKLKSGIPGLNGDVIFPKIVRIARYNFDYRDLEDISVQKLGLQYDAQVYDAEEGITVPRRNPSRRAKFMLGEECVVFLCTTSTAAGPMLKNLRANFSVIFMDEAGHASEHDTLCGLVAGARRGQVNGLHVVLVGDTNQLKPVFISQHAAVTFVNKNRLVYFKSRGIPISMNRQFISMFERLYERERCPFSWLTHQYRSHPHMARICTAHMYGDILVHPTELSAFQRPYNSVLGAHPLQPLTIIDTRLATQRREFSRQGALQGIHNPYEAEIINSVLFEIRRNRGHSFLSNAIIVTTPYRAQLRLLRDMLSQPNFFLSQPPVSSQARSGMEVSIDTIDSLQGSESSIVILSLTRSNRRKIIGFLRDNNRLNVAVTRAKHLLVLVGDFSTMCISDFMASIHRHAVRGDPGTAFRLPRPSWGDIDGDQLQWAQDNVPGFQ